MTFPFGVGVTTVEPLFWAIVAGAVWHFLLIVFVFWHWDKGETTVDLGHEQRLADAEYKYDEDDL
jgi:hypothetical protein